MSPQNSQALRGGQTVLGYRIYRYDRVSSTNEIAKEIARKTDEAKIVVLAETQTRGRGRFGRQWISPKGGLWFSIILRTEMSPMEAMKLTFITSLAVAETVHEMFDLRAEVKWPNDVLVSGKKICGILTETIVKDNMVEFAVIGVGINVNIDMKSFPPNLWETATSLKHELGYDVERKALMASLLQNLEAHYSRLRNGQWDVLLQEWKGLATFLHKQVEVVSFDERYIGEAWDIEESGALLVRLQNGTLKEIVAGEVTIRKTPCL